LFFLTDQEFRRLFRGSPLARAKRRGLLRSAAIVLGNQADPAALPALVRGLSDAEPLVRASSAWALRRLSIPEARAAISARLKTEMDCDVRRELETSLRFDEPSPTEKV
jgi:epoxyqueuosine reductase